MTAADRNVWRVLTKHDTSRAVPANCRVLPDVMTLELVRMRSAAYNHNVVKDPRLEVKDKGSDFIFRDKDPSFEDKHDDLRFKDRDLRFRDKDSSFEDKDGDFRFKDGDLRFKDKEPSFEDKDGDLRFKDRDFIEIQGQGLEFRGLVK